MSLLRWVCEWVTSHGWLPLREIKRGTPPHEEPYLDRYYLCGKEPAYFPQKCKWCGGEIPAYSATRGNSAPPRCKFDVYFGFREYACSPEKFQVRLGFLPTIFLHHFRDSDQEEELHNHPWDDSLSFVLAGGYTEERRLYDHSNCILTRRIHPFQFNRIRKDDFHRVKLTEHDAWTLFITGKKSQSWGFWSRKTFEFVPWRKYREWKEAQQLLSRKEAS